MLISRDGQSITLNVHENQWKQDDRDMDGLTETPMQREGARENRGRRVCNNRKHVGRQNCLRREDVRCGGERVGVRLHRRRRPYEAY